MLKKIILFLLITLLLISTIGCSSSDTTKEESTQEVVSTEEEIVESYSYTYNETEIELNAQAKPILDALGEEISYFESESCAFPGLDKVYTYPGLEVQTYEKEGIDHILSINLLDDTIATNKGIRLFDSITKVKDTYGDNFKEKAGHYIYTKGKTKLSFLIKDNEVIAIEYAVIIEDME
jgi:C-terminal processing protease CtpA/Prc